MMRNYLLAAVAAGALLASPATARDRQWYAGIEGGLLFAKDSDFDIVEREYFLGDLEDTTEINNFVEADHKLGVDLDVIAGYDFGLVRVEGELGFKRAGVKDVTVNDPGDDSATIDGEGHVTAKSIMGNVLFDFGDEDGWSFYAGPGIGMAWVKYSGIGLTAPPPVSEDYGHFYGKDHAFAWQLIAGVRTAISESVHLGLKYRYFHTGRLNLGRVATLGGSCQTVGLAAAAVPDCGETIDARTRFSSHSLLASLTFDFGGRAAPPPPPPPPPPAPEPVTPTQTCADGSVILATDMCPAAPAPQPMPTPERG